MQFPLYIRKFQVYNKSMSEYADKIRKEWATNDKKRDAGLTSPEDILRYDDILYGSSKTEQVLDVYRPKQASGKDIPVIVSVHGGAWVYGDKELYQFYCMSLAQRGFAVVNFTYRLAPENLFPSQLQDVALVFDWLYKNAADYGFDTKSVFAVGDSAGAHLLALYSCCLTNSSYAKNFHFIKSSAQKPKAIALNCGVYHARPQNLGAITELMGKENLTQDEMNLISVLPHITADFPPVFVMTSFGDFLKDQALEFAATLMEKKVSFTLKVYGKAKNPLYHVFHVNMKQAEAKLCNDDECNFFKSFL